MKKFSLLKKVCSAFVIVAMLASFSTVALAANPGAYVPADGSVQITDIAYEASTTVAGLYNVTVKCEVADDALDKNAIGVTMLTYAKKNESLDATAGGYTAYDDTMQIVGIDQKQRENGANTVEFKFAVTTNDNDGTNAYAVQVGRAAVILVSGDGLNPAAGLLTIAAEKVPATAASATASYDNTVDIYSYDTDSTIMEALKNSFVATTATIADATGAEIGTVELEADYITSVAMKDETVYTATAVIPADASVDSAEYNVLIPAGGLTVEFDFAVSLTAWEADTVAPAFAVEQNIALENAVDEAAIKALFVGKNVVVSKDGIAAAKATVEVTEDMVAAADTNPDEIAVDAVYDYTITIPDTAEYTVAEGVNTIAVKITIVDAPAVVYGDIDGMNGIGMADAILAVRISLPASHPNHYAATDAEKLAADVDGMNGVGMADAIMIVRRSLPAVHPNALEKFPVED